MAAASVRGTSLFTRARNVPHALQEKDFDDFKDRIRCYGLDLRDLAAVESFCTWMHANYDACVEMLHVARTPH